MNLISVNQLDDEGHEGSIRNDTTKFYKGSVIVVGAQKINTLYLMHAHICREEVNVAVDTIGELWHKRLCHMSQKGIHGLVDDNLILKVRTCNLRSALIAWLTIM